MPASRDCDRRPICDGLPSGTRFYSFGAKCCHIESRWRNDNWQAVRLLHSPRDMYSSRLESESFVLQKVQFVVEDDSVVDVFPTHAKRHANKAIDNWPATTNLARAAAELSNPVRHVERAPDLGSHVHVETFRQRRSRSRSCSCKLCRCEYRSKNSQDRWDGVLDNDYHNWSQSLSRKSHREESYSTSSKRDSHRWH